MGSTNLHSPSGITGVPRWAGARGGGTGESHYPPWYMQCTCVHPHASMQCPHAHTQHPHHPAQDIIVPFVCLTQGCCYGEHGCKPGHPPFPSTGSQAGSWVPINGYQTVSPQGSWQGVPGRLGVPHWQVPRAHSRSWFGGMEDGEQGDGDHLNLLSFSAGQQRGDGDLRSNHSPCERHCLARVCVLPQPGGVQPWEGKGVGRMRDSNGVSYSCLPKRQHQNRPAQPPH